MEYRTLGESGVTISRIGLGAWEAGGGKTWGPNPSRAQLISAFQASIDMGVNWVDTAEVYGGGGGSDSVVASVLRECGRQDEIRLCTKIAPRPEGSGFGKAELRRGVEKSLRRLGKEYLDVCLLHWEDPRIPPEEAWSVLAAVAEEGLVQAIGLSNFAPAAIAACHTIRPVDAVQCPLSILRPEAVEVHLPTCLELEIAFLAYGPLAYGLLAGAVTEATNLDDWRAGDRLMDDFFVRENFDALFSPASLPRSLSVAQKLQSIASACGKSSAQAALAWVLQVAGVTAAIAGTRSPEHAQENAQSSALQLEVHLCEVMNRLAGIYPT